MVSADLDVRTKSGAILLEMLVDGAKQCARMVSSVGESPGDPSLVLMSARAMADHPTALRRLVRDAGLELEHASDLLWEVRDAAERLALADNPELASVIREQR